MLSNALKQVRRLKWLLALLLVIVALRVLVLYWLERHSAASTGVTQVAPRRERPNIVLISLDTVRPDHLGCYGYAKPTTPNLDHFAALSTRFTNTHCQAPWTLLSHMSLFTSKIPSHNGVDSVDTVLPDGVTTLAQLLQGGGYKTAAIVHNAQMQAHWGFDRGFNLWYELDEKGGQAAANHVSDHALAWLASQPHQPYFLFLHYFDAHAPYRRPAANAKAMGSELDPIDAYHYMVAHRFPGSAPVDADHLQQLEGAYDGSINFLDSQVGRVLAAVPRGTALVIFSDHGEAFREHGRFGHGTSLYEEETRTVLMMRLPGQQAPQAPQIINQPVMLMDIAPTLLSLAGLTPPADFEGQDLLPIINGGTLGPRRIPSETRLPIERYAGHSIVLWPWKAIASCLDGTRELYLLPDETNNLAAEKSTAGQSLFELLDKWGQERDYWVLYAKGPGAFSVDIEPTEGKITTAIPSEQPRSGDLDDLKVLRRGWTWTPTAGPKTKMLYLQLSNSTAKLRINVRKDGKPAPGELWLGSSRRNAGGAGGSGGSGVSGGGSLPVETDLASETLRPLIDQPAKMEHDGVLVMRYHGAQASAKAANVKDLDAQTINRLRNLGYLSGGAATPPTSAPATTRP